MFLIPGQKTGELQPDQLNNQIHIVHCYSVSFLMKVADTSLFLTACNTTSAGLTMNTVRCFEI